MKSIWLPVLLLCVAGLALWLWRSGGAERPADELAAGASTTGYAALDAELLQTDEHGAPEVRLRAARIERERGDAPIRLTEPRIELAVDGERHWQLEAQSGAYVAEQGELSLAGEVAARGQLFAGPEWLFTTAALRFDTQRKLAETDEPVAVEQAGYRLYACGLGANLLTKTLSLKKRVTILNATHVPAAGWLAALCALPVSAAAPLSAADCDRSRSAAVVESGPQQLERNLLRIPDVTITQCQLRIHADLALVSAERMDSAFDNSRWQLSGRISISTGDGELQADSAELSLRGGQIESAVAMGAPARFVQQAAAEGLAASGEAQRIEYLPAEQRVRFSGAVQFRRDRLETSAESLSYDLRERRILAGNPDGGGNDRVKIVIQPRGESEAGAQP